MPKNLITTGDQYAEKGTPAWADWQRVRMRDALKETNFETRQLIQIIRDMCEPEKKGKPPAWHLMTRLDGQGFHAFAEFVTAKPPEGLGFADYQKFRSVALSEPGIMTEREYDMLTAPREGKAGRPKGSDNRPLRADDSGTRDKDTRLRAIRRAPDKVQELYLAGLISQELAAATVSKKVDKAKKDALNIALFRLNGSATRAVVEAAVREALGRRRPTKLDRVKNLIADMGKDELRQVRELVTNLIARKDAQR